MLPGGNASPLGLCEEYICEWGISQRTLRNCSLGISHLKFRTEQSFLWFNAKAELWQLLVFNVQGEVKQQDAGNIKL